MNSIKTTALFDLSKTLAKDLLSKCEYPWQALPQIKEFICSVGQQLSSDAYVKHGDNVWISKDVLISTNATIIGPAIIESGTELRTGAFIRGNVIIGKNCVIGNSCEIKNSIIFDFVQVPHFNYIGDSILGYHSHTGAGAITSNVKSDRSLVSISYGETKIETGLKKFGAMLGDYVEIGCNSVLNPGTIIGRNSIVYPLSSVRGVVPANSIYKKKDEIVSKN